MKRPLAPMLAMSIVLSSGVQAVDAEGLAGDIPGEPLRVEEAFASLLYGRYFRDPCAGSSGNAVQCPITIADRQVDFEDARSRQSYRFTENPCIIAATSRSAASGKSYRATFHLENASRIVIGDVRQNGPSKEYAFTLQGRRVVDFDGKASDQLIFLHKYHVGVDGEPGHDIAAELPAMQDLLKRYQATFCPGMT
jgi:hypothetical protein